MTVKAIRADCTAIIGASGMGKGVYATSRLRDAMVQGRQVLVWSTMEDELDHYAERLPGAKCRTIDGLVRGIKGRVPVVVFVPSTARPERMRKEFDLFCRAVWCARRAVILVEEVHRVTSPSWAPGPWQNLSTAGRHRGLTLMATTQRPARIDKDFLANCTQIRVYRLNFPDDARALAEALPGHRWPDFMQLPEFHYLHRDIAAGTIAPGIQSLPVPQQAPAKNRRAARPA